MDEGIKLPKHLECAVGFTYIGKHLQSSVGKHFDLGWINNPSGNGSGAFEVERDGIAQEKFPVRKFFKNE